MMDAEHGLIWEAIYIIMSLDDLNELQVVEKRPHSWVFFQIKRTVKKNRVLTHIHKHFVDF